MKPKTAPYSWAPATPELSWHGHPWCALQHYQSIIPGIQSLCRAGRTCAEHAESPCFLEMFCQWHSCHPNGWWRSPKSIQITPISCFAEKLQVSWTTQMACEGNETVCTCSLVNKVLTFARPNSVLRGFKHYLQRHTCQAKEYFTVITHWPALNAKTVLGDKHCFWLLFFLFTSTLNLTHGWNPVGSFALLSAMTLNY